MGHRITYEISPFLSLVGAGEGWPGHPCRFRRGTRGKPWLETFPCCASDCCSRTIATIFISASSQPSVRCGGNAPTRTSILVASVRLSRWQSTDIECGQSNIIVDRLLDVLLR